MKKDTKIYIAGHRGMVGSAIVRRLQADGFQNLATRTHRELDLIDQKAVREFFRQEKIEYVVLAAAKVGGIHANNTYPAEFIYQNLIIEANVVHEAFRAGIQRLLFLGSSCVYPKQSPQPMKEEYLLSGTLEPTNEPYAIAKIAGIKLCESYNRQYGTRYRSVMPTNLYGPDDNYDLENSHVLPALIRKFHLARLAAQGDWEGINNDEETYGIIPDDFRANLELISQNPKQSAVKLWGTGTPCREFLHVDDAASACLFVMKLDDGIYDEHTQSMLSHINVGTGNDLTIRELADIVSKVVGFQGDIAFDSSKPDGTPKKVLDVSNLYGLGWKAEMSLTEGISKTYETYLKL